MNQGDSIRYALRSARCAGATRRSESDMFWRGRLVGSRHELHPPGEEAPVVVEIDVPAIGYHGVFSRLTLGRTLLQEVEEAERWVIQELSRAAHRTGRAG